MAITTFGTGATGIVSIGGQTTGTAWGGSSGGFRVLANGGSFTQYDVLFTGATLITLGAYYAAGGTGDIVATLLDSTGVTTLGTITPVLIGGTFIDAPVTLFGSLTAGTTYWLRITLIGAGNDILCSANFLQLTTTTTATLSTPPGYGNVYTFASVYGGTNTLAALGLEGGVRTTTLSNWTALSNTLSSGRISRQGLIRFKATMGALYLYQYQQGQTYQLNQLAADGSSGVPINTYFFVSPGGANSAGWQLVSAALDNSQEFLWELTASSASGSMALFGIMTSGGAGINQGVTGSTLVRTLKFVIDGDSIEAGDNGTSGFVVNYSQWSLLQQAMNCAVLNIAIPGLALSTLSASSTLYLDAALLGVPLYYVVGCGINDVKGGSPPSATTLSGQMVTFLNKIRTLSGWSAVPLDVEAIDNYSGFTFAQLAVFNSGANGYQTAVVAAYNAGTASGQSPSPDPNVFYIPRDTWGRGNGLAGTYTTGGAFNGFYYDGDGLHPNSIKGTGNPSSTTLLSGFYFLYSRLAAIFNPSTGPIGSPDLTGGMQQLTGGI